MLIDFVKLYLTLAMILSVTGSVSGIAQGSKQLPPSDSELEALALHNKQERTNKPGSTSVKIELRVKDSTLEYILNDIARQANLKVVYRDVGSALTVRKSVDISGLSPTSAFEKVLEGTGLGFTLTKDNVVGIRRIGEGVQQGKQETGKISGRVTDSATGKGLDGVAVMLIGTKFSVTTAEGGKFVIADIPNSTYQLNAKLLGYSQKNMPVVVNKEPINLTIQLIATATSLNEVVSTATGPQRRVEVAHDIATINASEIMARSPIRSVTDILEAAQVPGVQVQRGSGDPGAPTKIRIRGISSISQTNDPVVIIDGIWIDAATSSPSKLDDIDPSTIEKIEVVRGPSAATLYGQDASNGVIVITTKKGKAGTTRWNFSYNRDWGQAYGKLPLTYSGIGYLPTAVDLSISCPVELANRFQCIQDTVLMLNPNDPLVLSDGAELNNKYVVQVDGGSNSVTYAITGTVLSTAGIRKVSDADMIRLRKVGYSVTKDFRKPSQLNRRNFTSRLDLNPYSNLAFGITLTIAQSQLKDNALNSRWGGKYSGVFAGSALSYFNADTNLRNDLPHSVSSLEKPISSNTGIVGGTAQYRPGHGVVINANVGVETATKGSSEYLAASVCFVITGCVDTTSATLTRRREQSTNRSVYTFRINTSTSLSLGKFSRFLEIRPSIGGDLKRVKSSDISIEKNNIPVGDRSISSGTFVQSGSWHRFNENATAGWYLNSTIGIARRVYFDVGVRQDIGSAITSSSQYPKLGGSWLISDESFWKNSNYINLLRLRTAIGHAAVQPDVQDIYGSFISSTEYIDGKFVRTARIGRTGNNKLISERATEVEIGLDADVLYDRVNIAATYARSVNKNALQSVGTPPSFGASSGGRKENIARVSNRNLELAINSRLIENTIAFVQLHYGLTLTENRVNRIGDTTIGVGGEVYKEGYPIGGVWTQKVLGYDDRNGNGILGVDEVVISDEGMYLGWSQPRYRSSYGISMTLLNQITFDSRFAYQSQYVKSVNNALVFRYGSQDIHAPLAAQAQEIATYLDPSRPVSDLRWNSASIQYQVPRSITSRINARSLAISIQGRNLGLWTNYVGRDPSINNSILTGEGSSDNGLLSPPVRLYVLDFKLGF